MTLGDHEELYAKMTSDAGRSIPLKDASQKLSGASYASEIARYPVSLQAQSYFLANTLVTMNAAQLRYPSSPTALLQSNVFALWEKKPQERTVDYFAQQSDHI